jgi:hypothetical protein
MNVKIGKYKEKTSCGIVFSLWVMSRSPARSCLTVSFGISRVPLKGT